MKSYNSNSIWKNDVDFAHSQSVLEKSMLLKKSPQDDSINLTQKKQPTKRHRSKQKKQIQKDNNMQAQSQLVVAINQKSGDLADKEMTITAP